MQVLKFYESNNIICFLPRFQSPKVRGIFSNSPPNRKDYFVVQRNCGDPAYYMPMRTMSLSLNRRLHLLFHVSLIYHEILLTSDVVKWHGC